MSITRAFQQLQGAHIRPYLCGGNVSAYTPVRFGADDNTIVACATTEVGQAIGIALEDGTTASERIKIAMLFQVVIPVKVGTGGATRGAKLKLVADGYADAAAHGGAFNTAVHVTGIALHSGIAGDTISMGVLYGAQVA